MFRSITTVSTMAVGAFAMEGIEQKPDLVQSAPVVLQSIAAAEEPAKVFAYMAEKIKASGPAMASAQEGDLAPLKGILQQTLAENDAAVKIQHMARNRNAKVKENAEAVHEYKERRQKMAALIAEMSDHVDNGADAEKEVMRLLEKMVVFTPELKPMVHAMTSAQGDPEKMMEEMTAMMTAEQKQQAEMLMADPQIQEKMEQAMLKQGKK